MAKKKKTIDIQGNEIAVIQFQESDYISLTDIAKAKTGAHRAADVIKNWIRTRTTLEFLGSWEQIYNPDFKVVEFDHFKSEAGLHTFTLSPSQWSAQTGAIGIMAKSGRYGGTYAHKDIAFEFAMAISPMFKLLLIKEFQVLKQAEIKGRQWDYHRFLSKVNYRLQTDTIRDHILPALQVSKNREWLVYADEADLLNMSVFGVTAKQWRDENPDKAKKGDNIRDYADIVQLNVLANLESLNSVLIERKVEKHKRFELLSQTAITQYKRLADNPKLREP